MLFKLCPEHTLKHNFMLMEGLNFGLQSEYFEAKGKWSFESPILSGNSFHHNQNDTVHFGP